MIAWLAAAVVVALYFLLLFALATATGTPPVRPGPPTAEMTDHSPAVVDLITGDWRLCDEAASATLLDLAGRGAVRIEEIGPELSLVRLGRPIEMNPYERLVFDHVRSLAVDGVVATGALAEGSRDLGRWWKSFTAEVKAEARERGLSRPRWNRAQTLMLTAAAVAPALAVAAAVWVTGTGEEDRGAVGAGFGVFVALVWVLGRFNDERGTPLGARVAGHWLGVREHLAAGRFAEQPAAAVTIWGRPLAYAAALGLAPRAVISLPVSTPADDRRAWSDYGGMWHVVNVRYPRRLLWGHRPPVLVLRALVAGFFTGFWTWVIFLVLSAFELWPGDLVVPAAWTASACVAALPIFNALADLTGRTPVRGRIVRLRARRIGGGGETNEKYAYWCAIDEGRAREVKAFGMSEETWRTLREGDIVRAEAGRRVGWINGIELLDRPRRG